jgi:hypothetical protein
MTKTQAILPAYPGFTLLTLHELPKEGKEPRLTRRPVIGWRFDNPNGSCNPRPIVVSIDADQLEKLEALLHPDGSVIGLHDGSYWDSVDEWLACDWLDEDWDNAIYAYELKAGADREAEAGAAANAAQSPEWSADKQE